ncbi:VIT1/CCC1 transporter family protein [Algoriphagus winogradskyi]|uniref:Predicted Fe2+/Mn2+ transporter, VIT1/CCC1 family n=1 Tax=Algoriphagus winogradskyi TaxID=237017 RepID=A0ABY1PKM8_9BACT|nr:VIT1/CCC1 transporter family protein [Algoriphagus winogradskyi]SMP36310.1 Predicted Fe2+/Mn2+ transporter, VIT1/CCC1 family [Algoriphagus winogradskyi]
MNEAHLHQKSKYFQKLQEYLREFVYGGIDGAVTTFAVVAGGFGADLDAGIIIILGFANLFADGFSMSVGAYLSSKSDKENYNKHQEIEYWEVENLPEVEREEIRDIYKAKGFEGELLEKVIDQITSNKDIWVAEMMKDELNLMEETKSPFKIGVATFASFLIVGFIPLLVYLWTFFYPSDINTFFWTSILTGLAFVLIGALKSLVNQTSPIKSIAETVALGLLAAIVAYYVGDILENFFIKQ